MRVLVTGINGQLGHDVMLELLNRGHQVIGTDLNDNEEFSAFFSCDLTDELSVKDLVNRVNPDAIIHCAAYTAVDKAEQNEELVYKVNALATKYLALEANERKIKLLYISTDYVFDGNKGDVYVINDTKNPLLVYGKTKSDGEDFVMNLCTRYFIVRTTGVFGMNGNNFIKTMLKLANNGKTSINVVSNQYVSVTYTKDLAKLLVSMIETEKYGIYHAANEGYLSWWDLAKYVFEVTNKTIEVNPISLSKYQELVPNQATRPLDSRLSMGSLTDNGFNELPNYKDAVNRYLKEIGELV